MMRGPATQPVGWVIATSRDEREHRKEGGLMGVLQSKKKRRPADPGRLYRDTVYAAFAVLACFAGAVWRWLWALFPYPHTGAGDQASYFKPRR
jgi:hypothetical protein